MLLISILAALTTLVIILLVYQYSVRDKQVINERMARYTQTPRQSEWDSEPTAVLTNKTGVEWRELIRQFGYYARKAPKASYFNQKMEQAGLPLRGSEFIVLSIGFSLITGLLTIILTGGSVGKGILIGAVAYVGALVYVNIKIAQRVKAFNDQLGDALAMMANSLRSGFSFLQVVDMVAKELKPPISNEFARVLKEMNLGVSTEDALNNLTARMRSDDLELIVTAVLIQRQVGGNLAQILDNIASTIRQRLQMKREIRTLTAQGRLSGWVIGLLPVAIMLILMFISPEYIKNFIADPLGSILLGFGLVSQMIGVVIIKRIVNINM